MPSIIKLVSETKRALSIAKERNALAISIAPPKRPNEWVFISRDIVRTDGSLGSPEQTIF